MPSYRKLNKKDLRNRNFLRRAVRKRNAKILLRSSGRNRKGLRCIPLKKSRGKSSEQNTNNWGINDLGIKDIWEITKGAGIKVAVLDTGIAMNHIEFGKIDMSKVKLYKKIVGSLSSVKDTFGHGTQCAGIIGAKNLNGKFIGVAPEATLMIVKVTITRDVVNSVALSLGIRWAADNGAHILSISIGSSVEYENVKSAIKYAIEKGAVIICAAGNCSDKNVSFPANCENTIAVGQVNQNLYKGCKKNGEKLDLVAPGFEIFTTNKSSDSDNIVCKEYQKFDGSSAAAPFLAGVVALYLAKKIENGYKPNKDTQQEIKSILQKSTFTEPHKYSNSLGWGVVNPKKLLDSI